LQVDNTVIVTVNGFLKVICRCCTVESIWFKLQTSSDLLTWVLSILSKQRR